MKSTSDILRTLRHQLWRQIELENAAEARDLSQTLVNVHQAEYFRRCTEELDNEAEPESNQGGPGGDVPGE